LGAKCSFCGQAPDYLDQPHLHVNATPDRRDAHIEMSVTGMHNEAGCFVGLAAFRDLTDMISLQLRLGELTSFSGIVGRDSKIVDVFEQIRNLASTDYAVHITGETGTGKDLVANAIHNESPRAGGPFVPVNCGALPEGRWTRAFRHVKGLLGRDPRQERPV